MVDSSYTKITAVIQRSNYQDFKNNSDQKLCLDQRFTLQPLGPYWDDINRKHQSRSARLSGENTIDEGKNVDTTLPCGQFGNRNSHQRYS